MRSGKVLYLLATIFFISGNTSDIFCAEIVVPTEPEQLKEFLLRGYNEAKSVLDDVRIEYEKTQIRINPYKINIDILEELDLNSPLRTAYLTRLKTPPQEGETLTHIEEYIRKNNKERWVFLFTGASEPTEDVLNRSELIGTVNSPRFRIFNGQRILDYYSTENDGFTDVGRATIDESEVGFFESYGNTVYAPVQFFGYWPGLMPDNVLSSPDLQVETKPETIGDLSSYKVGAPIEIDGTKYNVVYWLCPERSCLAVKTEIERNGKFNRSIETKEFLKLEDGRWVIKSVRQRNFAPGESEGEHIEIINLIYTIRKLELNPDVDEDKVFDASAANVPVGADVIDNIGNLEYLKAQEP